MPLRKTAIAVPDDLLAAVDRAARERHESRNRFVIAVLRRAVRARGLTASAPYRPFSISRARHSRFSSPRPLL